MASPVEPLLYPYQRRWLEDKSRFKVGMFARQVGKTFVATLEIVLSALESPRRWVILSRGERQAKEAMDEGVKKHLAVIKVAYEDLNYPISAQENALEVRLPNGSRITALPANPDTARGFSASVLLDEFAFHQDSRKIWAALFPVISAGHCLRVISTPNGKGNKFYELMTTDDPVWSKHRCDIYQAVREGLPRDIEQLRRALNDPDAWAQEYELQWLDEVSAWLDYDLIAACEAPECLGNYQGGDCYVGMDVGRRRDLTVIWVVEKIGDLFWTREVMPLLRVPFAEQLAALDGVLARYRVRRACLDETGLGMPVAEEAQRRHGQYRVEAVTFTGAVKQDLAVTLKRKFEDRQIRIPIDRDIRESLHSIRQTRTSAGNPRFDADRDEVGHGDYFWALALAVHGADNPVAPIEQVLGLRPRVSALAWGELAMPRGGLRWTG